MSGFLIFLLALPIYFIPSFVAYSRDIPSRAGVLITNAFFGWTFLGWIIALIWAFSGEERNETSKINTKLTECPDCGNKVSKKADSCPECGRPFESNLPDRLECVDCRERYPGDRDYCPDCGSTESIAV